MGSPGDFDLLVLILRVLEAWELGKGGLYRKYWSYKKIIKISKFYFGPGSPKTDFYDFSGIFLRKNGLEYGITSETTIPGISNETTETRESATAGGAGLEADLARRQEQQRRAGSYRQPETLYVPWLG